MLAWVIARMDKVGHGCVQLVLSVCVPNQNRPILWVKMSDRDHSLLNDLVQDLLSYVHVKNHHPVTIKHRMRGSFVIQDFQTFGWENYETLRVTSFWVAKVFTESIRQSRMLLFLLALK